MSNALAIAAVTKTLENLLTTEISQASAGSGLGDYDVKIGPPDQAEPTAQEAKSRLNLFLFRTAQNGALRNMELPGRTRPGETGQVPLALTLYYLLTAYGRDDDQVLAHKLLGHAMRVLHDSAVPDRTLIQAAMAESDLYQQVERVRIAPHDLSVDELSKLWSMFQTHYRISVVYEVSVVLIESVRPARTPLPVLQRSLASQADVLPPFPTLTGIDLPHGEPGVELGQTVTLSGYRLDGDAITVHISNPRNGQSINLAPAAGASARAVPVLLPDGMAYDPAGGPSSVPPRWRADWGPGLYTAALTIVKGAKSWQTAAVPFTVVPRVLSIAPPSAPPAGDGSLTYSVQCRPQVLPDQRVTLLLGDRSVTANPRAAITDTLLFKVAPAVPGTYLTRLRVDGADSLIVNHATDPVSFLPAAEVTIQ